jgi:hypothetical protein
MYMNYRRFLLALGVVLFIISPAPGHGGTGNPGTGKNTGNCCFLG